MKPTTLEIAESLKKKEFLLLLLQQVEKDLNIDLQIKEGSGQILELLYDNLNKYVDHMLEDSANALFTKLYRVDIDEGKLQKLLRKSSSPIEEISKMIIDREAKKVYIREFYKLFNKHF